MGKRKFIKPDDSDSEYEWQEAAPKKPKSPEIVKNTDELSGFLGLYSTKSAKELRNEKKQEEKEKEEKIMKDRTCVQGKVESYEIDNNWLRRVYNRMREQSEQTGAELIDLLRERYDERTINLMMKLCGGHPLKTNKRRVDEDSKRHGQTSQNEDNTKEVEERHVTNVDLNEAAAAVFKAEIDGNTPKLSKLRKKLDILREAQRRNIKVRLTRTKKDDANVGKSVMIEKELKSGRMIPYLETGKKFRSEMDRLVREEDATNADEDDWAFATTVGRAMTQRAKYEDVGEREYDGMVEPKKHRGRENHHRAQDSDKQTAIAAQKRRTAQIKQCTRCYKSMPKHLVLSKGEYFCVAVPRDLGLVEYHWQIVPLDHVTACTRLDDDAWAELAAMKARLSEFYSRELSCECVFMETVLRGDSATDRAHTVVDCVPLSSASRDIDPRLCFRKSIDEAKSDWAQNKGLLQMTASDGVRRAIPRELAYFAVEFTGPGVPGLAVVIDDERRFDELFGLGIVGSMLGKNVLDVRAAGGRGAQTSFNAQADVVLRAEKRWKRYNLWQVADSDDESD